MAQKTPKIQAQTRDRLGTRYSRRLRREGRLPAVVYGHEQEPQHLTLAADEFKHTLHSGAHIVEVAKEDGVAETCLIKAIQYDYLGDNVIHVDLARIDINEEIEVTVPVELKGRDKSPGAKAANAIVEQPIIDLEVTCLANNIPDAIEVDISTLEINQVILVSDLKLPAGVTTDRNPDDVVVSIHETKEEVEVAATSESAEPEVLTARKEDPAGASAAGDKKGDKK